MSGGRLQGVRREGPRGLQVPREEEEEGKEEEGDGGGKSKVFEDKEAAGKRWGKAHESENLHTFPGTGFFCC